MSTRTLKRVEASLSEDVFDIVKDVAAKWGMTTKSYLSMVITRSAIEDQQKFQQINDHSDDPDEKFALIEQKSSKRVQGSLSKLVKVIDRYQPMAIEEPIEEPTIRSSLVADLAQLPFEKVGLQLELPNGVRLTFSTAAPEIFTSKSDDNLSQ